MQNQNSKYFVLDADTGIERPVPSIRAAREVLAGSRGIDTIEVELIDRSSSLGTVEQYEVRYCGEYIGSILGEEIL